MDRTDIHLIRDEVGHEIANAVGASKTLDYPAFAPPPAAVVNAVVQPVVALEEPQPEIAGMSANELRSHAAIAKAQFGIDYLAAKTFETFAADAERKEREMQRALEVKFKLIQPEIEWYAADVEKKHNARRGIALPLTVGLVGASAALGQYIFLHQGERKFAEAAFQTVGGFVVGAVAGLIFAWVADRLRVIKLPYAMPMAVQQRFQARAEKRGKPIEIETWTALNAVWTESATEWNASRRGLADYVLMMTQSLQPVAASVSQVMARR